MSRSRFLPDILTTLFERRFASTAAMDRRPIRELCEALLSSAGEVSGLQIAAAILSRFQDMSEDDRRDFFAYLTDELDLDTQALVAAAQSYGEDRTPANLQKLNSVSEPIRQEFLRRLNRVPGATHQLVEMRRNLLAHMRETPDFGRADIDFSHLFTSWFNRGFLVLRRIDWDTPANILEKIIQYEAVHAIGDWDDLRRRIEPADRHCYAYFHPVMPEEPLIFVEVALSQGIPGSVQTVLAEDREIIPDSEADTAVFYSISNCQRGLAGISFGNALIKQVVEDLSSDLPHLKTFVTLSPVPGLACWLRTQTESDKDLPAVDVLQAAAVAVDDGNKKQLEDLSAELRTLAAQYLVNEKRDDGSPSDPVARFHLGNGALIHDVHAMADLSANGLEQSCGVMVNYLYDLKRVEQNHEDFVDQKSVAQSRLIQALLRAGLPSRSISDTVAM